MRRRRTGGQRRWSIIAAATTATAMSSALFTGHAARASYATTQTFDITSDTGTSNASASGILGNTVVGGTNDAAHQRVELQIRRGSEWTTAFSASGGGPEQLVQAVYEIPAADRGLPALLVGAGGDVDAT